MKLQHQKYPGEFHLTAIATTVMLLLSFPQGVWADIYEEPIQDKVYNEFLTWDEEILRYGSCPGCSGSSNDSPVQHFYFNEGAKIDVPKPGGVYTALYVGASMEEVDLTVHIGEGKTLTLEGYSEALQVGMDSKATFIGQNADLIFGANEWDKFGDAAIIYMDERSSLKIEAGSLDISNGAETNLKLFDSATANIQLTGDFVAKAGGTGIAMQNVSQGSDTSLMIDANNISLSTTDKAEAKRRAGMYLMAYGDAGDSKLNVDLKAKSKIDISGFAKGIQTFGTSRVSLEAETVYVAGREDVSSTGIYLDGYGSALGQGETVTSAVNITARESAVIEANNIAVRLMDRSALAVTAPNVLISAGDEAKWALYVPDNSQTSIEGQQTRIVGKVDFRANSRFTVDSVKTHIEGAVRSIDGSVIDVKGADSEQRNLTVVSTQEDALQAYNTESSTTEGARIDVKTDAWIQTAASTDYDHETAYNAVYADNSSTVNLAQADAKYLIFGHVLATRSDAAAQHGQIHIGGTQSIVRGDVLAMNGGTVTLDMSRGGSEFTGLADMSDKEAADYRADGQIDINLGNRSIWNVAGDSRVSSLHLDDSLVNLSGFGNAQGSAYQYRKVQTQTLSGQNGTLQFAMDLVGDDTQLSNDQLMISSALDASQTVNINFANTVQTVGADKQQSQHWLMSQEKGSLTVANVPYQSMNGAVGTWWTLRFVADDEKTDLSAEDIANLPTVGEGKGYWYLVRTDKPEHEDPTPEVSDNLTIGTSALQAIGWLAEKSDLRKRLGEVRYGTRTGTWVKAGARKDSVGRHGSFTAKTNAIHVGQDFALATTESSGWIVGGAFRYADSDQEGLGVASSATGKLDQYTLKAYATYMRDTGSYADFVLQAGYYEQELTGRSNIGNVAARSSYDSHGFGASVELGHRFSLGNGADDRRWYSDWYVEPQVELSYYWAKGANYRTSTGMQVDQQDADFLNGRVGLVVGKKWNFGGLDSLDKRYFQIALVGGMNYEFLGDQELLYTGTDGKRARLHAADMDGERFYYGLDFDWQLTDNLRAYSRLEREQGNAYTKDYDISLGVKYAF